MADLERLFREAAEAPEEVADQPAMMGEDDMRCPMCGASAKKIQEAAGGGMADEMGGPMKMGKMGGM